MLELLLEALQHIQGQRDRHHQHALKSCLVVSAFA